MICFLHYIALVRIRYNGGLLIVNQKPLPKMTTGELIHVYESAAHKRSNIFGVPGGALKPAEAAGELIKRHGHQAALEEASRKTGNNPSPWNFWYQVHCVLTNTTP